MHILAIWLIAIILPVQGFAATTMMHCEKPQSLHSHESVSGGHHHEHQQGAVDNHAHQHQDTTKHACQHCSKCSACCAGFTFSASGDALMHDLNVTEAVIGFTASVFTSHISSGPERPPRFTLI